MKKPVIIAIALMLAVSFAWGQDTLTDQDEKNLQQFSHRLVRMKRDMDNFMKELASAYSEDAGGFSGFGSDVRVDIVENPKDFVVRADLPGMDKDKITVTLTGNRILKIAGSREMVKEQKGPSMVRQERMRGQFERVIELPADCRSDGIAASYKNGVLEILIPKKEESKPETIKVNVQ